MRARTKRTKHGKGAGKATAPRRPAAPAVPEASALPLLDQAPIGVAVWRLANRKEARSLRLVYANPAASTATNRDLRRAVGRRMIDVFPEVPSARLREYADACLGRSTDVPAETDYGDAQLDTSTFTVRVVPLPGRAIAILFQNVTATRRAEAEARRLGRFLEGMVEHLPAMVFVKDAATLRYERLNQAGEELLGMTEADVVGRSDHDLFPKEQADDIAARDREALASGSLVVIPEQPVETARGTRWLHTRKIPILGDDGRPTHLLGLSLDVTERKRALEILRASHQELEASFRERTAELEHAEGEREEAQAALARTEEQLRHAQKMEAIGRLAGGVAHDFNNLLSVVLGYCEMMLQQLHAQDPMRDDVAEVHRAGLRAADLTRQLLAFSRQQVLQPRILDLDQALAGMQRLLARLLGEDIELAIRAGPGLKRVKADPGQVEQVVMNLAVNARDAMPRGGKLTIETSHVELDEVYAAAHVGASPGPHVMLAVSDTGHGMDAATMSRIFEPFFTTKEKGKGTGLGLSTVYGIVKQSGGSIWVYSEPGRGATFKVYLPATNDVVSARAPDALAAAEYRGSETILLVEDEDQVRTLAADILQRQGYRVLPARGPLEALARAAEHPGAIDLLLTDVVMPELGGRELAERIAKTHPDARVLFMSGYTDDAVVRHGVLEGGVAFLQKPLTPEPLARRVREALAAPRPARPPA